MAFCESFQNTDVVIVGAGLAGRWFSRTLSEHGIPNIVVGREAPDKSLMVQGAVLEKYGIFEAISRQGNALNRVDNLFMDYPDQKLVLNASCKSDPAKPGTAFYAISHTPLLEAATGNTGPSNIWDSYVHRVTAVRDKLVIDIPQQRICADYVVDATGPRNPLARNLIYNLDGENLRLITDDPIVLWCLGERVKGKTPDTNTLYRPVSRSIGSGSWILPWENGEIDLVAAGFSRLSNIGSIPKKLIYERFKNYCLDKGYVGDLSPDSDKISGLIRLQPVLEEASGVPNIFLVGDAAGFGSPAYGEVIPAILDYAKPLAQVLERGGTSRDFYRFWRKNSSVFPYSLEQSVLKLKAEPLGRVNDIDESESLGAGSNAALYRVVIDCLSPEVQREFLQTRKIPVMAFLKQLGPILTRLDFLKYLGDLGKHYLYVKSCELVDTMP